VWLVFMTKTVTSLISLFIGRSHDEQLPTPFP
jgi:hypothetical protein